MAGGGRDTPGVRLWLWGPGLAPGLLGSSSTGSPLSADIPLSHHHPLGTPGLGLSLLGDNWSISAHHICFPHGLHGRQPRPKRAPCNGPTPQCRFRDSLCVTGI